MLISEGLQYHLDNNLSLCDSIYREGSQGFLDLICEARALYNAGHIALFEEDLDLINSDLGTWGIYEGREVMLDYPMDEEADFILQESLEDNKQKLVKLLSSPDEDVFNQGVELLDAYLNMDAHDVQHLHDVIDAAIENRKHHNVEWKMRQKAQAHVKQVLRKHFPSSWSGGVDLTGSFDYWLQRIQQIENDYVQAPIKKLENMKHLLATSDSADVFSFGMPLYESQDIFEAEYRGRKVKLNKPKRGGKKKFYVYVRNPKTKKVKKVSFGAKGMTTGLRDPKRSKSFEKRHRCTQKNDKTKPGYWACRIGRYPKVTGAPYRRWW